MTNENRKGMQHRSYLYFLLFVVVDEPLPYHPVSLHPFLNFHQLIHKEPYICRVFFFPRLFFLKQLYSWEGIVFLPDCPRTTPSLFDPAFPRHSASSSLSLTHHVRLPACPYSLCASFSLSLTHSVRLPVIKLLLILCALQPAPYSSCASTSLPLLTLCVF
jgi:hypothetical protein